MLAKGSLGSLVFAWVHLCAPSGLRVPLDSRGFTRALLKVAWFIWVSVGSFARNFLS